MSVEELTRDQMVQLKQRMITDEYDEKGETPSWGELAWADETIPGERVREHCAGTDFVPEDFS